MAEPRKVQFVTLSAFAAGAAVDCRKRRLEEDEADFSFARAGEVEAATGAGGAASDGRLGKTGGDRDKAGAEKRVTVRLSLPLSEPDDRSSAEFNYGELIQNLQVGPGPDPHPLSGLTSTNQAGGSGARVDFMALKCLCVLVIAEWSSAPCPSWTREVETDHYCDSTQRTVTASRLFLIFNFISPPIQLPDDDSALPNFSCALTDCRLLTRSLLFSFFFFPSHAHTHV